MDFSKTTLQDLDTKKTDKSVNENQNQDTFFINNPCANRISHELLEEQHCKYELANNFNTESKYHHMESCNNKQNALNLKYKQLEPCEVQNRYSSNDITSVHRIGVSSNMSDLTDTENTDLNRVIYGFANNTNVQSVDQDSKFEQTSTLEAVLNKPSSISNLCDKKIIVQQLNNDNILTTPDTSAFLQETYTNVAKTTGFQKELKKNEMVDDAETIEKIAEMIAISSKNSNENNPKTKKRLQMLMSRNSSNEQDWNSSAENIASTSRSDSNISPLKINADDSVANKNKPLTDPIHKKRKYAVDSQISGSGNATGKIENNEISEDNFSVKSRFEEIENKLEEMFAGIEDEQLVNTTTTDDKNVSKKPILDSTDKCVNENCTDNNTASKKEMFVDNSLKYEAFTSNKSPHPTKAAKKSTTSFSSNENNKQENALLIDEKNPTITKSMLYLKTMPPRRRLSIGMNVELLKISVANNNEINEKKTNKIVLNKEEDMTPNPNPLNVQNHKEVKNVRKDYGKSKIKNNNKNGSKYKKEISYIKSNKKKVLKTEAFSKTKQSRQKLKQRRIQRLLSSDNDNATEEKALQTRDIETKHRSPFILVKNNGSITVVNTVTADDSNEKWSKSKKTSNYAYERKTVKGCHSSTLSNRYDADTADSSWICVFCKIGPHKKGLGDLFGPYIISSDCDEYRCNKDSTENFQKNRRTGLPYINFSKKSVKYINDSLISVNQNISEFNEDHPSNSYMLGMSQISDDCFEIWIHEECAVWAPNIFVIGSRLAGLEDATWNSMRYECVYCLKQGALLCCLQRDCKTTSHVPCAREFNWLLDESRFWAYCNKHVVNKF